MRRFLRRQLPAMFETLQFIPQIAGNLVRRQHGFQERRRQPRSLGRVGQVEAAALPFQAFDGGAPPALGLRAIRRMQRLQGVKVQRALQGDAGHGETLNVEDEDLD